MEAVAKRARTTECGTADSCAPVATGRSGVCVGNDGSIHADFRTGNKLLLRCLAGKTSAGPAGHLSAAQTCVNSRPKKKICADQYDHNSTTTIDPAAPNADPTAALPR